MSYVFKKNLVPSSKYSIKCPYQMTPKYVVVHDTGNSAPATNEISYMISNNNQVSFHIAVDENMAIQGLPLDRNAWACGDGANGNGNRKGISVEICRPTNPDRNLYDKSEENAVYVVARLLYKFNIGIDGLKRHYDFATNKKQCPNVIIRENRWDGFKGRVQWVLDEIKKGNIDPTLESGTTELKNNSNQNASNNSSNVLVKVICDELNIRKEPSFNSSIVGTVKKGEVFTITEQKNGLGRLKSGVGWISMGKSYVSVK